MSKIIATIILIFSSTIVYSQLGYMISDYHITSTDTINFVSQKDRLDIAKVEESVIVVTSEEICISNKNYARCIEYNQVESSKFKEGIWYKFICDYETFSGLKQNGKYTKFTYQPVNSREQKIFFTLNNKDE